MILENVWRVGYSDTASKSPNAWKNATVPGAVQLDWALGETYEDYKYADTYKEFAWMEDVYWTYQTRLDVPPLSENEELFFVSKGIDYEFSLFINNEEMFTQEGMFTTVEIPLTGRAQNGDEFRVVIRPVPKRDGAANDRTQADQCCKPAVSYGWDWHPRLVPLGIWDETYFEVRKRLHLKDVDVSYGLNHDYSCADIQARVWLSCAQHGRLEWKLFDPQGEQVHTAGLEGGFEGDFDGGFESGFDDDSDGGYKGGFEGCSQPGDSDAKFLHALQSPQLWWPNGQGDACLYRSEVSLFDDAGALIDKRESRIGFRRIKLVMNEGTWDSPTEFPKSRSDSPAAFEVNGRQIFAKGSNWVNPEIFSGLITRATYEPLLLLAKDANMNILRSWGGGIINKESFFNLCDELGMMVWQEFPLACNDYFDSPRYLKVLDQESNSIINRIRRHACLALWCGGNELFNAWSGMTEQSLALRLLDRNCFDLDPGTPFIMTSPLSGMAHGSYLFRETDDSPQSGKEVFEIFQQASNTAYTEFGCPGPSSADYVSSFIPGNELFPPKAGGAWEAHHGFNAWTPDTWLSMATCEHYFGAPSSLEELVAGGQWLQCEGYKAIFEEARRQRPHCGMALNWCYNEPWPTAANNSLVNWPASPKPAYYSVKNSCRPALVSARISKFSWTEGEVFSPELWLLNDLPTPLEALRITATLSFAGAWEQAGDGPAAKALPETLPKTLSKALQKALQKTLLTWDCPEAPANCNVIGPVIRFVLPTMTEVKSILSSQCHDFEDRDSNTLWTKMILRLTVDAHPEMDSQYVLQFYGNAAEGEKNSTKILNQ